MMRNGKALRLISLGAGLAVSGLTGTVVSLHAFPAFQEPSSQPQPDNTGTNMQDDKKGATTADQQKENAADRDLARRIRRSITDDKSLSNYAHNVKVIVRDGMVTLKGPVRSAEEKNSIGAKAAEIAGADKVQNRLTVKA